MPFDARQAALEFSGGIALSCAAAALLGALPGRASVLEPAVAQPAELAFPTASGFEPTRRPEAPPRELGAVYDRDSALPARAEAIASYTWHVRLDERQHRLFARGSMLWKNPSKLPASELYFHLYLNAFKNSETLFLRSPFGAGRSGDKATQFGYIDIKKMLAPSMGGRDLWQSAEPHTPGDPADETDIRVPLPEPVPGGGSLELVVEFEAQLPEIVERTGYSGSYHFAGQWFPKLSKREVDGTWVHFPFHPQGEFYADFGNYEVTLDLPRDFVVGATGRRVSAVTDGERQHVSYRQRDVTDFAWVAWDGFQSLSETIAGVEVLLLYPEGYTAAAQQSLRALSRALPHFNRNYGRYPYATLTVVHPPEHALNSGGMEYPTLITTGSRWYTTWLGIREVELVTIHELAHQWFYGMIATNEHAWPFLDEGLSSYAEQWASEELYGPGSLMDNALGQLSVPSFSRALAASRGLDEIIGKPASDFASFGSLGALVYQRAATVLDTLGRVYGRDQLSRALGRYARYYRFRHPTPAHLVAALAESLGAEAAENFEKAVFDRGFVDYLVRGLDSVPKQPAAGVFQRKGGREQLSGAEAVDAPPSFWNRAVIARHGNLQFPVEIELAFADGSRMRRRWNGEGSLHIVQLEAASSLVSVQVDPDYKVRLDSNLLNNTRQTADPEMPVFSEASLFAAELALYLLGP